MFEDNVCKFIPAVGGRKSEIVNFIYEKNEDTMRSVQLLRSHRMCLISRGSICFYYGASSTQCSAGDILFLFEGERCRAVPDGSAEYFYISFCGSRYEELFRRFDVSEKHRHFSGHDGLIPLWSEGLFRAIDDNIDLVAESMLLYTFGRFSRSSAESTDLVNSIISFTESHFTDPELTLSTLSKQLCYNPKYISRLFKKRTGTAYTEYLRMLRLKNAIALFDHGLDSIKNVTLLSGFTDPLYFSSVFKKSVGRSPKEYIASRRDSASADHTSQKTEQE